MILDILINDTFSEYMMKEGNEMNKLSRINILIGKNNSGKSRFLRRIFSSAEIVYNNICLDDRIQTVIESIIGNANLALNQLRSNGWSIPADLREVTTLDFQEIQRTPTRFNLAKETIAKLKANFTRNTNINEYNLIHRHVSSSINTFQKLIADEEKVAKNTKRIYLPMLRGLRPLQLQKEINGVGEQQGVTEPKEKYNGLVDNYLKRTQNDYFKGGLSDDYKIITGLHLYDETRRLLLGTLSDRKKVKDFESFINNTFFSGKEDYFSITPREGEDVLYVRIGQEEGDERPIYDLGDGIQAIIILTYPLFFYKDEYAIICFEEPETHLHPGLQRLFIETLLKFDKFQYFITTHSNHFLDLTTDYDKISVYTFSKELDESPKTIIENVESEHENILQLIGARASSVFLSNCTIWVEGITDRLYLRKYLELYQSTVKKKFREDYHYSFVEYGGSNITHWSFLDENDPNNPKIDVKRLCSKLFLVTDSDGARQEFDDVSGVNKTQKANRLKQLRKNLGERYHCLKCREIENLLSPQVLKQTIIDRAMKGISPKFKTDFKQEDYSQIPLGTFIKANVIKPGRQYNEGTINGKPQFCRDAMKNIKSLADLSPEALELTKKLYKFIAENNKS